MHDTLTHYEEVGFVELSVEGAVIGFDPDSGEPSIDTSVNPNVVIHAGGIVSNVRLLRALLERTLEQLPEDGDFSVDSLADKG